MAEISRSSLFGKLNAVGYKSIESATVFCKMRGNPYVELVHWINQVLQLQDSDLHRIIRHFELNPSKLAADMTAALDRLPRGSTSVTDLSGHLDLVMEQAWVYATLMFKESQVRTGHIVLAALKTQALKGILLTISREFEKVKADALSEELPKIVAGSPEDMLAPKDGSQIGGGAAPGEASGATAPAAMGKQQALKQFSVDLTEQAKTGKLDPIVGRDDEIRQVVDILMRRRQNNPILTGEAGVGKTAVVEGFAQRIAAGDVPPPLKNVSVRTLDLGLLQAGASMKGEFEQRLRNVIEEVQASATPIILFIDEAHTLIGAGGQAGTGDAANLLKPALARGTLRTIAATTWAEYKKYFEDDPALTRRFQVVKVDEPSEPKTLLMMRNLASNLEKHHRVQILDEALDAAVKLSHRYIPARQLPDKAVSLIDTACARVAVGQHAVPAEVEESRRKIEALQTELGIVDRESAVGMEHDARRKEIADDMAAERDRLKGLESRWNEERELVNQILDIRGKLRAGGGTVESLPETFSSGALRESATATPSPGTPGEGRGEGSSAKDEGRRMKDERKASAEQGLSPQEREQLLAQLKTLQTKLSKLQGETPLILPSVDAQAVASVVASWTGIPVGRMVKNEIEAVLKLTETLEQRVIGQRHALDAIAQRIRTSRAGMDNPARPVGVFMLVGPSGVGKTETALALAETLYGGEQNVITLNMSEYKQEHTVSTLKGAPPGYVGYGKGGILTEAVRRRPYSVVLLDEFEKAHKAFHELFFQVFDKGVMEDGEGRLISFKNTIILMTSNVGSDLILNMCKDPDLLPNPDGLTKSVREPLRKVFPDALLGRLIVVPYYPISDAMLRAIVKLQLGKIARRMAQNQNVPLTWDDSVIELVRGRCTEVESGARAVDAILTHTVLPEISTRFLNRMMEAKPVSRVHIAATDGNFAYTFE
jgi:type VI secretion system protein VasG